MNAILRVMYQNRIVDYDLSTWEGNIREENLQIIPTRGQWGYSTGADTGYLKIGDTILVNREKHIAAFVVEKIEGEAVCVELKDGLSIGRKSGNDIILNDKMVSGSHCSIHKKGSAWHVLDQGSTNGTYINDINVAEAKLKEGDVLKLGRYQLKMTKKSLQFMNADDRVTFNVATRGVSAADVFQPKPYPWFSPAPRMYGGLEPLSISIESAPSIGDKPKMSMGAIALDPAMMAMSLGTQALRYAMGKRKHSKQEQQRAEVYANYLMQMEARIQDYEKKQRNYEQKLYPAVADCVQRVHNMSANLWERHPGDEDFLSLRFGTGKKPTKASIQVPQQRLQLQEDELDKVPGQLKEKYAEVKDMPIYTSLLFQGNLGVMGARMQTVPLVQSMVAQIASLHNYKDVKIIPLFSEQEKEAWQWMRWLPHCISDDRSLRYMACGKKARDVIGPLEKMVKERMESKDQWSFGRQSSKLPHLVFVVAAPEMLNGTDIGRALMLNQPELGISGIFLGSHMMDFPHSVRNVCEVPATGTKSCIKLKADGREYKVEKADPILSVEEYEAFARKMAPIRMPGVEVKEQSLPTGISLFDGISVADVKEIDFEDLWQTNATEKSLTVPIGVRADGSPLYFDIHEKEHGPHGMVAGTAGSGKSEMAQTWIAMMAMQYSPEEVNFVLVDFKGDSLLQPFENLPHLAGSISNLDIDVARKFAAIESELQRRQRVLSDHECKNIIEYTKKRRMNPGMPVLPYTILVVDEFAEFKTQFPSFAKSLDQVYRVGRSLGFFVILMTQKPSGVVTDQMRANTHFKWCLRVQEESDSREMIGTTDAALLHVPGRAYVKTKDSYELVQVYYAGAEYSKNQKAEFGSVVYTVALNGERRKYQTVTKKKSGSSRTQLEVLMDAIGEYCRMNKIPSAEPIWQKELSIKIDLFGEELKLRAWSEDTRWYEKVTPEAGPLAVLGLVDDPAHQSQYALVHDFWENGNMAVYGMPMSGKTTFLQNMMVSLCNQYTPEDIQFYGIELSGFGLRQLEVFPHVGGAAGKDEPEAVEKITGLLLGELDKRKKLFRKAGAGSPGMYMEGTGEQLPAIVLLIDNLNLAGMEMPSLTNAVLTIAREGNAYGIYVACSFSGTTGVNYSLLQNFKTSYALELSDKSEYNAIVGRPGAVLPKGGKGRGLIKAMPEPLLFQAAVPFAELSDNKRTFALRELAEQMAKSWKGVSPQKILTAPEEIPFGSVEGMPFVLGLSVEDEAAVTLPVEGNISLLVSATADTAQDVMKCLVKQVKKEDARSVVHICNSPAQLEPAVENTVQELRNRQAALRKNPEEKFEQIYFFIYDFYDCTNACRNEIISRLEVFIRLGKGLGICVIGIDSAEKMTKCRFRGDILTVTMQQGAIMLVGGAMHQHQIADVQVLQKEYPQSLDKNEAILLSGNKVKAHYRRMLGE